MGSEAQNASAVMRIFPTGAQWRRWGLPAKASYIGTWLGIAGIVLALGMWLWPASPSQPINLSTKGHNSPAIGTVKRDAVLQVGSGNQNAVTTATNSPIIQQSITGTGNTQTLIFQYPSTNVNLQGSYDTEPNSWIFDLLRSSVSRIALNCPGEKCMEFELGEIRKEGEAYVQEVFLSGEGFDSKRRYAEPGKLIGTVKSPIRVKGNAYVQIDIVSNKTALYFGLRTNTSFTIFTLYSDVKFRLLDNRIDSLKLQLTLAPSTLAKIPPNPWLTTNAARTNL